VAKIGQWLAGTLAGLVEVLKAHTRETHERLVIDEVVTGPVDAVTPGRQSLHIGHPDVDGMDDYMSTGESKER
jgi:hypothetical protein